MKTVSLILVGLLSLGGCTTMGTDTPGPTPVTVDTPCSYPPSPALVTVPHIPPPELEAKRELSERIVELENVVAKLQDRLAHTEGELAALETQLGETHNRADAVSALAAARVAVQRAARDAPWDTLEINAANDRLEVAEGHIDQGDYGAAAFFAYRANQAAERLISDAKQMDEPNITMFIKGERVNLRAGPSTENDILDVLDEGTPVFSIHRNANWVHVRTLSGEEGWVHASLLNSE